MKLTVKGTTFKRCNCRTDTGKTWGARCPKLRRRNGSWSSDHGIWQLQVELPARPDGSRRVVRRGGFATQAAAEESVTAIRALMALPDATDPDAVATVADAIEQANRAKTPWPTPEQMRLQLHTGVQTESIPLFGDYLDQWLAGRKTISDGTRIAYASHIRLYYKPHLGAVRIDRLRRSHFVSLFEAIEEKNDKIRECRASDNPAVRASVKGMRITGPATMQRIRATGRAALNDAIPDGFITSNPATLVELPSGKPPKPIVWTVERVQRWRDTGEIPGKVMVWTPELTGQFLDHAADHELYPLFHLIALRGLRRGEAVGLPWTNVDLTAEAVTVDTQLVQRGWNPAFDTPKSEASRRTIALDSGTTIVLRAHREGQAQDRERWEQLGHRWPDTGLVFTHHDGTAWHPADVTDLFQALCRAADLPPIRLHDLRHGAATLALAGGADLKTVQDMLGHANYTLTADTYTSVLPEYARAAAENAARLVPRVA